MLCNHVTWLVGLISAASFYNCLWWWNCTHLTICFWWSIVYFAWTFFSQSNWYWSFVDPQCSWSCLLQFVIVGSFEGHSLKNEPPYERRVKGKHKVKFFNFSGRCIECVLILDSIFSTSYKKGKLILLFLLSDTWRIRKTLQC